MFKKEPISFLVSFLQIVYKWLPPYKKFKRYVWTCSCKSGRLRMPRRKKKSCLARKQSLVFTESPVHVQNNVPSPVLCARHPPTASTVSVDELHDLPWISPQFRNVRLSGGQGKRRFTRQRRHSVAGHKTGAAIYLDGKENVSNSDRNRLRKFNSLRFLGDKTSVPSIIEDVEISIDTDTESDNQNERVDIQEKESYKNEYPENDVSNPDLAIGRRNSKRLDVKEADKEKDLKTVSDECFISGEKTNDKILRGVDSMSVELEENNEKISDLNCTKRRHSFKDKPPIKRLFASQLQETGDDEMNGEKCDVNVNEINQRQNVNELDDNLLSIPDSDTDNVSPPVVRRSERIRELRRMLLSTDSPCSIKKLTCQKMVLAPNTPESEYGWSKRKRQLISYIKKKS